MNIKFTKFNLVSNNFKNSFIAFVFLMVIYSLLRLIFYLVNSSFYSDAIFSDIIKSFLFGLRFDTAAILMINIPVLVLYNFPLPLSKYKLYNHINFVLFTFLNLVGIGLNIADLGYYPTIQRRLTFEPFTAISDTIRMVPALFTNYAPLIIAIIFSIIAFILITFKIVKKFFKPTSSFSFKKNLTTFILVIGLLIVGIRGGLQLKPIRQTNAFFSDNRPLGYLVLNSTYTVLRSLFQYTFPEYKFFNETELNTNVKILFYNENEQQLDPDYPFLRKFTPKGSFEKKNVVIFIMESWSAQYVGSITGEKTYTPFFDSLANNGILFTNFFASGQRSIEAVPSVLASIPAVFPSSFIGSRLETNKIRGLGSILKEMGYTTSFHHGAKTGSMGFDAFVPSAGFSNYYGKEEFEGYADSLYDGTWGIYDEPFFIDVANKINRFNSPFCSVIFSLSSHDPFKLPKYRKAQFDKFNEDNSFQKLLRYSDYSLKKFFEYAQKQNWYSNTVFIITADHTLYTARNDVFSFFHIPLVIFSPQNLQHQIITKVGSQVDILPTILDLLNIPAIHSSMGKSLLNNSNNGFAATAFYPTFLCFSDSSLYVDDFDKKQQFFENFRNTQPGDNSIEKNGKKALDMQLKIKTYMQAVSKSVNNDLIYKK